MSTARVSPFAATGLLLLATACWGVSFPLCKAAELAQFHAAPAAGSLFLSSLQVLLRFGLAAVLMLSFSAATAGSMRGCELRQGLSLGFFSGVGTLLQMDGVYYTQASTSAFLTQATCVLVPLIVAAQRRRWPPLAALICCCLVLAGVTVLAHINPGNLRLGRGELETLLGAVSFSFQIVLLGQPGFAGNRARYTTAIMFTTVAAVTLPVVLISMGSAQNISLAFAPSPARVLIAVLAIVCTVLPFTLMNHFQKEVSATAATVTYCFEPVFATAFAMALPSWLSRMSAIAYVNERASPELWIGGGLIVAANLIALRCPVQ